MNRLKTNQLPDWTPAHQPPKRAIPHAIVQCKSGVIAPGKYSALNHCWLIWNGKEHAEAEVLRYIDLGKMVAE